MLKKAITLFTAAMARFHHYQDTVQQPKHHSHLLDLQAGTVGDY
jgi:hypothetical protein